MEGETNIVQTATVEKETTREERKEAKRRRKRTAQ